MLPIQTLKQNLIPYPKIAAYSDVKTKSYPISKNCCLFRHKNKILPHIQKLLPIQTLKQNFTPYPYPTEEHKFSKYLTQVLLSLYNTLNLLHTNYRIYQCFVQMLQKQHSTQSFENVLKKN